MSNYGNCFLFSPPHHRPLPHCPPFISHFFTLICDISLGSHLFCYPALGLVILVFPGLSRVTHTSVWPPHPHLTADKLTITSSPPPPSPILLSSSPHSSPRSPLHHPLRRKVTVPGSLTGGKESDTPRLPADADVMARRMEDEPQTDDVSALGNVVGGSK